MTSVCCSLREIIAGLSPYEAAVARKALLEGQDSLSFDVIACLPREISYLILGLLDPRSLNECAQVARLWRSRAMAKDIVGNVVRRAAHGCRLPAAAGSGHELLRLLLEREWRWTHDRPTICKAVATFSSIAALAVSSEWFAASYGRRLLAWRVVGGDAVLSFDVWTISAKSLSICSSGETLAYASYLRHAVVYSLATREEQFTVRSEVEGIDQVDILHEYFALQKQSGAIEIYNWKQRRLLARIAPPGVTLCSMKICSREWIAAASTDWNVHVFRIADGSSVATVDSGSVACRDHATDHRPRLKATALRPELVKVALFSSHYWLVFDVHARSMRAQGFTAQHAGDCHVILDAHFSHMLTASKAGGATGWQSAHVNASGRRCLLSIPAPSWVTGCRPQGTTGGMPRAAIDDDNMLASVQQGAIAILRFAR
ncbi:hypothetical protein LPJ61_004953 [Coemansia biformis]|uniref:F-box domain-containing protein n=1 Tax=Coemansia biformis TaxID=1286918 RepID=A0A9W8CUV3_9FUNG|nr:hypothetical protein LPJ61_004953 [Coemansia biformis]